MSGAGESSSAVGLRHPQLPPGFRFHPTDEELVIHYLKKKAASAPLPVAIIADVDLYKFDPWELPAKATFGEQEWYFFSPRDRKYPNGARPNRAATSGYWKATGTDKPVLSSGTGSGHKVGVKKALVFYGGKPPKGIKTNWIMHEYRLVDNNKANSKPPGYDTTHKKGSLRLDDWVLCRIYKKNNPARPLDERDDSTTDHIFGITRSQSTIPNLLRQNQKQPLTPPRAPPMLENEHNLFEGMVGNETMNNFSNPQLPLKRAIPSFYNWNEESQAGSSSSKRVHEESANNEGLVKTDEDSSIATLLSQLPQTPSMNEQNVLGSLGDGGFRQQYHLSGLNWYS